MKTAIVNKFTKIVVFLCAINVKYLHTEYNNRNNEIDKWLKYTFLDPREIALHLIWHIHNQILRKIPDFYRKYYDNDK